jgi:RNA polymerase primary sigma factor/RNA polymerase sigma factor
MPNPEFAAADAEKKILGPPPEPEQAARLPRVPAGIPAYLASLYEVPLLTPLQERYLFRKFNYLKYRAAQLREQLNPRRPNSRQMDEIERLYEQIVAVKNELLRANLRLVVAIAKRYLASQEEFFDLVSDGNVSLMRAVEKFDYALGNKFSTYASWAIKKNFTRAFASQMRHSDRFRTSLDEVLSQTMEYRANPRECEQAHTHQVRTVDRLLGCLDEREHEIISQRFGLGPEGMPQTLQEVGDRMGLTKERIRQLETRAMGKLRHAAQQAGIELPAA